MCIFVLIFNNKDKRTKMFYIRPLWPKYSAYFVTLKGFVFITALLRQNSETNMTKNRDKIVKSWHLKKKIVIW